MGNTQAAIKNLIGKSVQIGKHKVQLVKLIAEGGFAYVFLVKEAHTGKLFALKRLMVQDDESFKKIEQEVEIMKNMSPHKNIIKYYDSTITKKGSEMEIFILMEYCSGGSMVDIMNQRITNRFTEGELLTIFGAVCEAVAHMHLQAPPIAHRDLKVENVLISETGEYKLCDFGSATTKSGIPHTKEEMNAIEEDIAKNTTLVYRSPEMVDLYMNKIINEKVDIWALGCLLYKLAFYVTPFEEEGPLAIVNAKYNIPESSKYSKEFHSLIDYMLNPDPDLRPSIVDVLEQVAIRTNSSFAALQDKRNKSPASPLRSSGNKLHVTGIHEVNNHSEQIQSHHSPKPSPRSLAPPPIEVSSSVSDPNIHSNSSTTDGASRERSRSIYKSTSVDSAEWANFPPTAPPSTPSGTISPSNPFLQAEPIEIDVFNATSGDNVAPNSTLLRTLILHTWKKKTSSAIYRCLDRRPAQEPAVSFKILIIVHKLLQGGYPIVLRESFDHISIFNNIYSVWSPLASRFPDTSSLICTYVNLLVKKIYFHYNHPEFEGNFSLDTYLKSLERKGMTFEICTPESPINTTTLQELVTLLSQIDALQELLLVRDTAVHIDSLRTGCIKPLIQEAYFALLILTFSLSKIIHVDNSSIVQEVLAAYPQIYGKVVRFFAVVAPYQNIYGTVPTLPETPPVISLQNQFPIVPPASVIPEMLQLLEQSEGVTSPLMGAPQASPLPSYPVSSSSSLNQSSGHLAGQASYNAPVSSVYSHRRSPSTDSTLPLPPKAASPAGRLLKTHRRSHSAQVPTLNVKPQSLEPFLFLSSSPPTSNMHQAFSVQSANNPMSPGLSSVSSEIPSIEISAVYSSDASSFDDNFESGSQWSESESTSSFQDNSEVYEVDVNQIRQNRIGAPVPVKHGSTGSIPYILPPPVDERKSNHRRSKSVQIHQ